MRSKSILLLSSLIIVICLSSCYHQKTKNHDALVNYSAQQLDSISFSSTHHYSNNYNFVVKSDSLVLLKQQPEEIMSQLIVDSIVVKKHDRLVVADIRIIPNDSIDSVWVQLARDQSTFGWIHESRLLNNVVPDDPISEFISTFSDVHLLIFLVIICFIAVAYTMRNIFRRNAKIVHFNDIDSFYPTLLTLIVATAATFYASIQLFAPETWRHFYYHPTLNPFSVPAILSIFLISVWAILIITIAAIDDTRSKLPFGDAVLYLCGLAGVCAVDYIIFSISTLYYIGYLLLAFYFYFAIKSYFSRPHSVYICGNCGAKLNKLGRCPYCGTINK
jgi:uncharacterized membrane protein